MIPGEYSKPLSTEVRGQCCAWCSLGRRIETSRYLITCHKWGIEINKTMVCPFWRMKPEMNKGEQALETRVREMFWEARSKAS